MSEDPSGFVAFTPIVDEPQLVGALDRAMEPLGFSRLPSRERRVAGFDAPYANSEDAKLPCFGSSESPATDALGRPLARWLFFPLHAADIQRLSSFTYLSAIRAACVHTDVVFGRAFHATFVDMVSPEELHGAIDMLTWVQYFGPGLSSIIGVQRLRTAAWYALECLPTGAHLARTAESYGDLWPWEQRRPLLDHLGFVPRKLHYKTGPDATAELRWC